MKKTIIVLMALCGITAAETVDLLASSTEWTLSNTTIEEGVLQSSIHWGNPYAYYTLPTSITLNPNMELELSYTMTFQSRSDVAATVALHSSGNVLAFGAETYCGPRNDAPLCIGYSTDASAINSNAITFGQGYGYIFATGSYTTTDKTVGIKDGGAVSLVSHNIKETIAWSDDEQKYVATIYVGEDMVGTQILGDSYVLNKISVASAGNSSDHNFESRPSFSNMQLKIMPEPTTATLSLLALAGLAARRRRRK